MRHLSIQTMLGLILVLYHLNTTNGQSADALDEAKSYVAIIQDNAASIRSCDVLVRHEYNLTFKGKYTEHTQFIRLALDFETEKILFASDTQITESALDTDATQKRQSFAGVVFDGKNGFGRRPPDKPRSFKSDFEHAYKHYAVPDVRVLGVCDWRDSRSIERLLTAGFESRATLGKVHSLKKEVEVTVRRPFVNDYSDKQSFDTAFRIDKSTNMPKQKLYVFNCWHSPKRGTPRLVPLDYYTVDWEWQKFGGTYVPTTRLMKRRMFETFGDENFTGEAPKRYATHDTKFFWISVNKPIPEKMFRRENIEKTDIMLDYLDPEKIGAVELMDNVSEE